MKQVGEGGEKIFLGYDVLKKIFLGEGGGGLSGKNFFDDGV